MWRGRLEISTISVDEASLNLVRTRDGRWNLDPLFRTAAAKSTGASPGTSRPLPYLEATNSRVNIKNGLEKLPFSLVNADLSFWQENPGDWRVRLRGQPARTDVSLDLADTGIVQMEASLSAVSGPPQLHHMPVHLDLEWREAQLGQLSRLILGSDPGWRGDLTGELHLDGTAESAQVKTRLRATGVHRAEFAPAEALDFDANCTFAYHYSARSVDNLSCDSPLGDGHFRILGSLPGNATAQTLSLSSSVSRCRLASTPCALFAAESTMASKPAEPSVANSATIPPSRFQQHRRPHQPTRATARANLQSPISCLQARSREPSLSSPLHSAAAASISRFRFRSHLEPTPVSMANRRSSPHHSPSCRWQRSLRRNPSIRTQMATRFHSLVPLHWPAFESGLTSPAL